MDDDRAIIALYPQEVEIDQLVHSLSDAGTDAGRIAVMTPLPLEERASAKIGPVPLYAATIMAGLIGIGVGLFLAGGTALLYPLMTGGKPIVSAPIVGIIAYETMMLLAIVATFVTMIVAITRSHGAAVPRDSRIDDGYTMVVVSLPADPALASRIQGLLQRAGAEEIRVSESPDTDGRASGVGRVTAVIVFAMVCLIFPVAGCSRDMEEQPSYQPQESPRLHSPIGSVPRDSRSVLKPLAARDAVDEGARLFRINCSHCHGSDGTGDSPVVAFLQEKPADLLDPDIRALSEEALYDTVTHGLAVDGRDVMPPFKGELSAEERRSVAMYVKSLSQR